MPHKTMLLGMVVCQRLQGVHVVGCLGIEKCPGEVPASISHKPWSLLQARN